jgi:hypothetical protein
VIEKLMFKVELGIFGTFRGRIELDKLNNWGF